MKERKKEREKERKIRADNNKLGKGREEKTETKRHVQGTGSPNLLSIIYNYILFVQVCLI
jgi:hypothetical protein